MHPPITPEKQGARPVSFYTWLALLACAVAIYLGSQFLLTTQRPGKDAAPLPAHKEAENTASPPDAFAARPEPRQREIPPYLKEPALTADMVTPGVLTDSAFYYLLYQFKTAGLGTLAAAAIPAPPPDEIGKLSPGTAVTLEGTVISLRPRDDLYLAEGDIPVVEYEVKDSHDNLYLVFAVYDVTGIDVGDHAKMVGRFLKVHPHVPFWKQLEVPAEPDESKPPVKKPEPKPTPVLIVRGLEAPQFLTDPSVLQDVLDATFGQEPKAFYYLVHQMQGLAQEEIKRKANADLTLEAIERAPAAARGKFVGIRGTLILTKRRDEVPNIGGLHHIYRCICRGLNGQWFWVYTLDDPVGLSRGSPVKVYGVFFKNYTYINEDHREQTALLFVARALVPVEYRESPILGVVTIVLVSVVTLALAIALLIERGKRRQFNRHLRELSAKLRVRNPEPPAGGLAPPPRKTEGESAESDGQN